MSHALAEPITPAAKSSHTRPSALPVLAALLPLTTVPLVLLILRSTNVEGELPVDRFNEGGIVMYPLVALAAVAASAGVVGAFFAQKGRFALWAGSVFFGLTVPLVGAIGFALESEAMLNAAVHADPNRRGMVLRGALGETDQMLIVAATLAAALFATQGISLILGYFTTKESASRRLFLAVGIGLLAVGVWQGFSARELDAESVTMKDAAHADPVIKIERVTDGIGSMVSSHRVGLVALFLALGVATGGAFALRRDRRGSVKVVLGILVPVVVLAGARAAAQVDPLYEELMAAPTLSREVLALEAPPVNPYGSSPLFLGKELVNDRGEAPNFEYLEGTEVSLALEPAVTTESLMKALSQLRAAGVSSVSLIGQKQMPVPAGTPESLAPVFNETRGLTLGLAKSTACRNGCKPATLDERGVTWGERNWPLKTSSAFETYVDTLIPLSAEGLKLEQLLSACHSVVGNGGKIVLLFPD